MSRCKTFAWAGAASVAMLVSGAASYASATYTVDIRPELNGLPIDIDTVEQSGGLIVNLTNRSPQRVRCNLRFEAQPQTPRRRDVSINPGATRQVTYRAERRWFTVQVDVRCEAPPAAEAKD